MTIAESAEKNSAKRASVPNPGPLAQHFAHAPGLTFLNHGSFGATPHSVLEAQSDVRAQMESDPVDFFLNRLEPMLDRTRATVAPMIGAKPEDILFVRNASTGVAIALEHIIRERKIGPGDQVLTSTHEYAATNAELRRLAARFRFDVVSTNLPFPVKSPQHASDAILAHATSRTKLAVISAITSPSAIVMPIDEICAELRTRGILTIADAAHMPGHVECDIAKIGCDAFVANMHKWLCAPKSAATLWFSEDLRRTAEPHVMSSRSPAHRADRDRARHLFDYTGTDDYTPAICAADSIEAVAGMVEGGWPEIQRMNHDLAIQARDILCKKLRVKPTAPDSMTGAMAALRFKADNVPDHFFTGAGYDDPVQKALIEDYGIQIPVWPAPDGEHRIVRLSAFIYNTPEQYEYLAEALAEILKR